MGVPDPMINMTFSSSTISGTNGKETKLELSLHGWTLTAFADPAFVSDISVFFKPPAGVSQRMFML